MKWEAKSIGQLGRVVTGRTPPTKEARYFGSDMPFITPGDMHQGRYVLETDRGLSSDGAELLRRVVVPADSVCVGCIGWQMGEVALTALPSITNQQINTIVPDSQMADPRFIYYSLQPRKQELLSLGAGLGTRTPILKKSAFSRLTIRVPPLPVQLATAAILSAYDDLIENNRRRMKLLEDAARLLYQEWFVRLRFPGHERVRIKDGVPEGWVRTKVASVLQDFPRKKRIHRDAYLESGSIPCVDQSAEFIGGYTDDEEALHSEPLPVVVFGDHTRVVKFINFPFASGADGTQLIYPNRADVSPEYLYFALDAIDLTNYFYARHFKFLKAEAVLIPPESLVREFTDHARVSFLQTRNLRQQNQKLRAARDLLLPRLMSGEVNVSTVESQEES